MSDVPNPYEAPTADLDTAPHQVQQATDADLVRKSYLKHEASVQSIGLLYYIGGALLSVMGGSVLFISATRPGTTVIALGSAVLYLGLGFLSVVIGRGLHRLDQWVRIPVVVLSAIGLLGFPIGTIINAYILYLILSPKGKVVLSPEYKEVIRQTPHIKYRSSMIVVVFLVMLILLLAIGLIGTYLRVQGR